ncbi:NTP transferase domain-containing protein [Burkholderia oklahomensis]|uniref:2-C-methyl-D-erythritol 4-phosphate cytidylyltransferase family protein n=1 Tax=Burkholderia oklahomensis TaxID=342113 RepID=A0AAI8FQW6_9BURK|nr:NTP transferase domain-containing protein [Burkholderia oklahomensis]AIO70111.1 2-C-methyl-D-erythritol 4-phosphate cytidylyltransferase family protein [Burkholderia oklahomensis]QPS41438.1 NTP transferase domain-containing protein [Burkholderia oklahomensis]
MQTIKHAVIPCAGVGSRLNRGISKSLTEIGGTTLLARTLRALASVPNVFVIVGYQKERVIQEALRHRNDLVFVPNEYYDRTNTLYSVKLASRMIDEDFLLVDGDVVFCPISFELLLTRLSRCDGPAVGYSRRMTDDGGRMTLTRQINGVACAGFHRGAGDCEWTGIARLNNDVLRRDALFVYETIDTTTPVPAFEVDSMDIDTPADLAVAQRLYDRQ